MYRNKNNETFVLYIDGFRSRKTSAPFRIIHSGNHQLRATITTIRLIYVYIFINIL